MTQEQKDILLKDLCARLPYRVKVQRYSYEDDVETIETLREIDSDGYMSTLECDTLKHIAKPYLFPLSSMTEEQLYTNPIGFAQMLIIKADRDWENITINRRAYYKLVDWFNKNHFDYRGLIPMGLAIDATNLGIY